LKENLVVDLHKDFVDVECVAIASMLSLQSACIYSTELIAPQADLFAANGDASFGKQVFNISVAEIELLVEPNGVADNVR
jgi:hypothetical protein